MNSPRGYTLIELLVATASASVLMVGLSGALFVSARALETDEGATLNRSRAEQALSRVLTDLGEATRIETLTATEVRFRVPDRDADGLEEQLAYSWSGVAGDPLRYEVADRNVVLLSNVTALDFTSLERVVSALDVTVSPPPPWPLVESFSSVQVDPKDSQLVLPAPAGISEGDLLMAAVATHKDRSDTMTPPTGWAAIDLNQEANQVTLGVWWKLATDAEPADYTCTWSGDEEAIGVGLRISNQYAGTPITAFTAGSGSSATPICPAALSTLDNSLVLRFGGFHKDEIATVGDTGLVDHTDAHMDSASSHVSLGVGHRVQQAAGDTGAASFVLTKSEEYRTLTVVIAPAQD